MKSQLTTFRIPIFDQLLVTRRFFPSGWAVEAVTFPAARFNAPRVVGGLLSFAGLAGKADRLAFFGSCMARYHPSTPRAAAIVSLLCPFK
jgi:hypothetical protein